VLLEPDKVDLWLIAGRQADFESNLNRYGLSLVSAMVDDARESPVAGVCVGLDILPDHAALPILLQLNPLFAVQCAILSDDLPDDS